MRRFGQDRDPLRIVISGTAGQGAVFSATLIAEAAAATGKTVAQTARSSAAVRSGRSTAHVTISNHPIDFPYVDIPDILIALSPLAFETEVTMTSGGLIFFDASLIDAPPAVPAAQLIPIPATDASSNVGLPDANLMLVGAACHSTGILSVDRLIRVIQNQSFARKAEDIAALELGRSWASGEGTLHD